MLQAKALPESLIREHSLRLLKSQNTANKGWVGMCWYSFSVDGDRYDSQSLGVGKVPPNEHGRALKLSKH